MVVVGGDARFIVEWVELDSCCDGFECIIVFLDQVELFRLLKVPNARKGDVILGLTIENVANHVCHVS